MLVEGLELLPVAMHPDRVIDWCFDEDEKGALEKLWGSMVVEGLC